MSDYLDEIIHRAPSHRKDEPVYEFSPDEREDIVKAIIELREARKDSARLNWLDRNRLILDAVFRARPADWKSREAIDKARKIYEAGT